LISLLIVFTYRGFDVDLRFPKVASARAQGNFCSPIRPQFSSFLIDAAKVRIFHCGLRIFAQLFSIFFGRPEKLRASFCSIAVAAVLQFSKGFPTPQNLLLYLYINIELFFDYHIICFGTATLQRAAKRAQSQACLGYAERQRGRRQSTLHHFPPFLFVYSKNSLYLCVQLAERQPKSTINYNKPKKIL